MPLRQRSKPASNGILRTNLIKSFLLPWDDTEAVEGKICTMLRMEYKMIGTDRSQPRLNEPEPAKPQVDPEVSEVMHMLNALQSRGSKTGNSNH
jgi:hypothetical protein